MKYCWGSNDCVEMVSKIKGRGSGEKSNSYVGLFGERSSSYVFVGGLSFITSTVGFPVKPHPETIASTKLDEAKIFLTVDVSKVLPKKITFSKDGKHFTIKFYYP